MASPGWAATTKILPAVSMTTRPTCTPAFVAARIARETSRSVNLSLALATIDHPHDCTKCPVGPRAGVIVRRGAPGRRGGA
jgi:hypothetical protein